MAAYAALLSLLNNIEQIQSHTRFPISLDKHLMKSLHEKVSFLIDFLENHSHGYGDLESRITNVAYEAEDIIETHVVDIIVAISEGDAEAHKTSFPSCVSSLYKVMEDMDFIKEDMLKNKGKEARNPTTLITDHSPSSVLVGNNNTMVGFNEELMELMERLTGYNSSRVIIPIIGMGGMGKTTLAKTTYAKPLIVHHFDVRVWVSISQEYSLKHILLQLLGKRSSKKSEDQLGERLYKSLCGMRYLVILDDMWSAEPWEAVKVFFPDNRNGSRIIVTTRISNLATIFCSCSLEMKFLDDDQSWNLFCEKVFAQDGCPLELEEVGRKIVNNCKGLPLSIVVIAGLLAKSEQGKGYWEYIAEDTKAMLSLEGDEQCMKILSLSYHNLPIHLKPCFLYMGAFPEDGEIYVSWLIKQWVAEGILKRNSTKELEIVGEECLNNLVGRNLILVCRRGINGNIKSCMIHDLLRDLCLKEAQKEKFLHVPKRHSQDNSHSISSQRRISIHQSSLNDEYIPHIINAMKSGSMGPSLICDIPEFLPLQNFRLLRVLKVSEKNIYQDDKYSLHDISPLVNSRFIAINHNEHPAIFPSSVCFLWNLQILIVRGVVGGPIAPPEIWEMTELRHLQFEFILYLSNPPSQQMNRLEGDAIMKNLQTLKHIEAFRCTDEVVKRIPNVKRLEVSYQRNITGEFKEFCLENLGLLKKLESLVCLFDHEMAPSRSDLLLYLSFPSSLTKLTLSGSNLPWKDMTMIGSLPHLEVLKLDLDAFTGPEWVTVEGEFCHLKSLEMSRCGDLVHWISEGNHFPFLVNMNLHGFNKLVEIPSGIGEHTLRSMLLEYCCNSAVISAKKILEEQEDLGNEDLYVHIFCQESTELESLASDHFLIQVL